MRKIRISAEYSKKNSAYANFLFHVCSSSDNSDKNFKGFDTFEQLLF